MKTYNINGKKVIHRALSPMQLIRIAAIFSELQTFLREAGKDMAFKFDQDTIDMTLIYEVLAQLEKEKSDIIVRLINTVFIDAETARPCYLTDKLGIEDFYAIDPPTFLEVVADFFTLNYVSKTSSLILGLMRKVTSSTESPIPSAVNGLEDKAKAN